MSVGWLLALAAAFAWGSADFLAGRASARSSVWRILATSMGTGAVLAAPIALVVGATTGAAPATSVVWWALLAGVTEIGGYAGLYRALAGGPLGVASSIAGMGVTVPVAAGVIAGGGISGSQGAGLLLAVLGIGLVGWTGRGRIDARCMLGAGLSASCFGVSTLALAQAAQASPVTAVMMTRAFAALLLVPVALLMWWRHARRVVPHRRAIDPMVALRTRTPVWLGFGVLVGVLDLAGTLAFAVSTTQASLPVAALTSATYPMVTALLARILLAERLSAGLRGGAIALVVGSALLAA